MSASCPTRSCVEDVPEDVGGRVGGHLIQFDWVADLRVRDLRRLLRSLAVVAGCRVLILGLTAGTAAASGAGHVTIYWGISGTNGITAGPDGALWFTNRRNNAIERITTPAAPKPAASPPVGHGKGASIDNYGQFRPVVHIVPKPNHYASYKGREKRPCAVPPCRTVSRGITV
jgi:hypothetical protein